MYVINLIIIYDVVNIFSMKNYESLRKLRMGVNRYTGVNWSTTTIYILKAVNLTFPGLITVYNTNISKQFDKKTAFINIKRCSISIIFKIRAEKCKWPLWTYLFCVKPKVQEVNTLFSLKGLVH